MSTAPSNEVDTAAEIQAKPPFLRRVRIRGYKSIAFCDVTLEPLTILVGRNASGKSNFLDALGFLRDIVNLGLNDAVKRHGGAEGILCRSRDDLLDSNEGCASILEDSDYRLGDARLVSIEIEGEFATVQDLDRWSATYRIDIEFPEKKSAKIRREELKIKGDQRWVGYTNDNGDVTCIAANDGSQQRVWKAKDRPFLDTYNDTHVLEFCAWLESLSVYNFQPEQIRRLQTPNPGWLLERDGSNLASVIETTRENDEKAVARVGRYLTVITGSVEFFGVAKYGDYETVKFRVARNGHDQLLEFDAASMSDGTLRVLAALMGAFQIVLPHGSPSLVAIEEPETSLHPAAMRALVAAMDEATLRTQILLTTHSPDLLDATEVKPANVRVVKLVDGQTVIGPVDEASVSIVRDHLSTLGGLERDRQLEPDFDDLERQAELARQERNHS